MKRYSECRIYSAPSSRATIGAWHNGARGKRCDMATVRVAVRSWADVAPILKAGASVPKVLAFGGSELSKNLDLTPVLPLTACLSALFCGGQPLSFFPPRLAFLHIGSALAVS